MRLHQNPTPRARLRCGARAPAALRRAAIAWPLWAGLVLACSPIARGQSAPVEARVIAVYDGDTFRVRLGTGEETVRLLGIDCPETSHRRRPPEPHSAQAAQRVRSLAEGRTVRLSADPAADARDRYERILRYAFLEDGRLLNALLIEEGLCRTLGRFPFSRLSEFAALEAEARRQRRGLWQDRGPTVEPVTPQSAPLVSWREAHQYYGRTVVISGTVVATKNTGRACFLNFHPDWRRTFTAVIFAEEFGRFPEAPEDLYRGRKVRVTGKVREYHGKPEIIVKSPGQIRIVE
ncbi:MAG: thermonuclease family protein [Acidobacteriota bacterium]